MAMQNSIVLLTCLLAAIFSVHADEPEKLVGARNAGEHEYPFVVSIRINGHHHCGGSIISNTIILTAAHCVHPLINDQYNQITIVTGTNTLSHGGEAHLPETYFIHPSYQHSDQIFNWQYDIGAIKLQQPIQFNDAQKSIPLPTGPPPPPHSLVKVVAWGATAHPPGSVKENLQFLDLKVVGTAECQQYHQFIVNDNQICTFKAVGQGTCQGDSGSPLVYNNQIIGLVSAGIKCASEGIPDIFTNVYAMMDFIQQVLNY